MVKLVRCNKYNVCNRPICTHKIKHYEAHDCASICAFGACGSCEGIPKPAKVKRVRAWADVGGTGTCKGILFGAFPQHRWGPRMSAKAGYKPCWILISDKYLAKAKGERK